MWSNSDPNSPRARITTTTIIAATIALTFLLSLAVTLGGLGGEGDVLGNDGVREGDLGGGVVSAADGGGVSSSSALCVGNDGVREGELGGGIVSAADGGGVSSSSVLCVGVGVDVSMEVTEAKED